MPPHNPSPPKPWLGAGVTLQIILLLVALGIAYGRLQIGQVELDRRMQEIQAMSENALKRIEDVQNRLARVETQMLYDRRRPRPAGDQPTREDSRNANADQQR